MYGLTRGTTTLIGAGLAGLLLWISTQIGEFSTAGYWGIIGLIAGAGLIMSLSQLIGGWTKWGWPLVSASVFFVAFLPVLVATGWVILDLQPSANWFQRHIESWSGDIGITGLVHDLGQVVVALAFGLGLVFGFVFDTTGPRTGPLFRRRPAPAAAAAQQEETQPDSEGDAPPEREPERAP